MPTETGSSQTERQAGVRIAAIVAVAVALLVVAIVALTGGDGYEVKARFLNASQLVKGNVVTVSGENAGTVEDIELTDDGQALVTLKVDDDIAPLRQGTRAIVKQRSLSGVANRFVELQLGPDGPELDEGAEIPGADTQSAVDLDQVFNTFDEETRDGAKGTIRFLRDLQRGNEDDARDALRYLDPALSASSRLFAEVNRDRADLERFVVQTGRLTTDLAARDDDLAGLITNLGTTMSALAAEREDLGAAIETLPAFLRRTNTTFVNLRATLDDVDPLVRAAKPVVRTKLRPLFDQLRPLARDAAPTVRDLSQTIRADGADNDLIDLLDRQPAVDAIANDTAERNGKQRPGAFKATQDAAKASTPQIAQVLPYAPELVGWFDDFSRSGVYDALGGFSRAGLSLSQFTFQPTVQGVLNQLSPLLPTPLDLREALTFGGYAVNRNNRCPGSLERGTVYKPDHIRCDPSQVPVGR